MMKRSIIWALAFASTAALADGVLKDVQGEVKVDNVVVAQGAEVKAGSTVITGLNSRAVVRFDDGQIIAMGGGSMLKVKAYTYAKAEPAKDNIVLDFLKGTMRAVSGSLGARNPSRFALTTPTATAGIRGTDFSCGVVEYPGLNGAALQKTICTVKSGSVKFTSKAGSVVAGKGQSVEIMPSGKISPLSPEQVPANLQDINSYQLADVPPAASGNVVGGSTGPVSTVTSVAVPVASVAGGVAGAVAATSDNSTVTGTHHGATSHHGTNHHGTTSHH